MFNLNRKDKVSYMLAPQTGKAVSVRGVPDDVFSEKILGDGVAIIPTENAIFSPVNGEIVQVAETGHAFCIKSEDGLDILIHIGIDTVALKGMGFKSKVKVGQKVKAGEPIAEADIKLIEDAGYYTHTVVLITNMHEVQEMKDFAGEVTAGKDHVITYIKK